MSAPKIGDIRNIALVGHSAAGKTLLGEAILHKSGVTGRVGDPEQGTSFLDYDDESKERKHSTETQLFHVTHHDKLLNFIVTPGMPDYNGQALAALSAVETAIIVISAASGIGVNTRKMFNAARDQGLAIMIVITKFDSDNVNLPAMYQTIRETFGAECHPINLPSKGGTALINVFDQSEGQADFLDVDHSHTELIDAIVETDESLMSGYVETGTLPPDTFSKAIAHAVAIEHVIPVMFVNRKMDLGISEFLDACVTFAPSPLDGKQRTLTIGEGASATEKPIIPEANGEFFAQVFRVATDTKSNIKYAMARVFSGKLGHEGHLYTAGDRKGIRPGHFFKVRGPDHTEIPEVNADDIMAFAKLDLKVGDVVSNHPFEGRIAMPRFPKPMFALAVEPKNRGDVEKISAALHRYHEEDPCFEYHRDAETHELLMQGLGDLHLTVIRSRMKRYFKVEFDTHAPKIPYRETITGSVKYVEHTHKKQTGGAGQFAKVAIDMEPNERGKGYEFVDKIFGGVIDLSFRPAVDKGCQDQMKKGVIAGYPVVDVKISLVDGKTHPVDSKDIAFQVAGRAAFKKAFTQCRPILLEPIVDVEVTTPADCVGQITRDLSGRRGQVTGQDILSGNQALIKAKVPLAEVASYASQLKSVTAGQGSYSMDFSHYDIVPPNIQQQIVAAHKPVQEED